MEHPDLERLLHAIEQGERVVFFVGAGVSRALGYPTWRELLDLLIDYGSDIGRLSADQAVSARSLVSAGNYLLAGQILRDLLARRLDDRLEEIFSEGKRSNRGLYDFIVRIPAAGFLTTNYDSALEDSFAAMHGSALRLVSSDGHELVTPAGGARPFLWKIHGDAARRTAVISSVDYERILANGSLMRNLYSLLSNSIVVYLGYGMNDGDLLTILEQLVVDRRGFGPPHFAFMPDPGAASNRLVLEDRFGINVITYDSSSDHLALKQQVLRLFLQHRPLVKLGSDDLAVLCQSAPLVVLPELKNLCDRDLATSLGMRTRWGPSVGSEPRAATIAEGLLALAATRRFADHSYDPVDEVGELIRLQRPDGGFESSRLGATNVQTQALGILALHAWSNSSCDFRGELDLATKWLLSHAGERGWRRFTRDDRESPLCTAIAMDALLVRGQLREELLATALPVLEEALNSTSEFDIELSVPLAGWTLRFLADLRSRRGLGDAEAALVDLCLRRVSHEDRFPSVKELVPARDAAGRFMWRSWVHPTPAIVALGCVRWLAHDPRAYKSFGAALLSLLKQEPLESVLHRGVSVPSEFVFPSLYRIWAVGEMADSMEGETSSS